MREQIVSGQTRTDSPIRQDALAAELGVSKTALREALGRLEQGTNLPAVAVRNRELHVALVRPAHKLPTTPMVERLSVLSGRCISAHPEPPGASRARIAR